MLWHNVNLGFVYVKQVCFIYQHTAVYSKTPAPVVLIGDVSHYLKKKQKVEKNHPFGAGFLKNPQYGVYIVQRWPGLTMRHVFEA